MSALSFPVPPKRFKKVKPVKVNVHDLNGATLFSHSITVYMDMKDSPEFVVFIPDEYALEWDLHGHSERAGFYVHKREGDVPRALYAPNFEAVVKQLEAVSYLFAEKVRTRALKKVIALGLEASSPPFEDEPGIRHEPPSFSKSDVIVGVRSGIYFEVNGKLFRPTSRFDESNPDFNELNPQGHASYNKIIPYTDEAWLTVCRVNAALRGAAKMLHTLITGADTETMLIGGLHSLLPGPAGLSASDQSHQSEQAVSAHAV